jgi:hypothetical protein
MLFPMLELRSVTTPELRSLFAMVHRIKYTHVADIVDYFKNVHKCRDPSSVPPWSLGLPQILGVRKWPTWPTLRGIYLFLILTIFSCAHLAHGTRLFSIYAIWSQGDLVT